MKSVKLTAATAEVTRLMAAIRPTLTLTQIAGSLMVSEASVRRWENGESIPHPGPLSRLRQLVKQQSEKAAAKLAKPAKGKGKK